MATSNQDTNIKDVAAPASATTTNIGHVLGLNAAKTQDVLIPLSMLRTVIAAELKTALAAITSGSPDVPVLDGNNLKNMTLANFAKVVGGQRELEAAVTSSTAVQRVSVGSTTATIPKGGRQAILFCTVNGSSAEPSIFIFSRPALVHSVYEGTIKASAISVDSTTGDIIVTRNQNLTLYYRLIIMEA